MRLEIANGHAPCDLTCRSRQNGGINFQSSAATRNCKRRTLPATRALCPSTARLLCSKRHAGVLQINGEGLCAKRSRNSDSSIAYCVSSSLDTVCPAARSISALSGWTNFSIALNLESSVRCSDMNLPSSMYHWQTCNGTLRLGPTCQASGTGHDLTTGCRCSCCCQAYHAPTGPF